ncbi:tryptophan-rich sensory protein [uncultured Tateyamaria sp.]|uniref:tryptophan-rich sensory protein n=1 Tax=uncultured Tateyamaria sp. TaxID=455651 RepID=UPI002618D3D5|nr:tryptophan-rich sensory protein [uncultured Tateyamaria sp.]
MAYLVLLLTLAFAASTLIVPDFGGFDADQFPVPQNNPPVQPAGYAFAIWGVIYLWLLASALFGVIARRDAPDWQPMRPALAVSLGVGAIWLPAALLSPILATVLIWVMLIPALIALWQSPVLDRGWAAWPIALYAGWLSAASCVAIGLLLAGYGWLNETATAITMILIASALAYAVQTRLGRAPTYGIAVIWAFAAIIIKAPGDVATVAMFGLALVAFATVRAARA